METHGPSGMPDSEPGKGTGWATAPPSLASGFVHRPETGRALETALVPGSVTALVSDQVDAGPRNWRETCGKTQLAVAAAHSLLASGTVERVIWLTATSRASVLSGYAEAAKASGIPAVTGTSLAGDTEFVAARFLGWLRDTDRPWLVVLDDLTVGAALDERLWPAGPTGRVLVTTADRELLTGRRARVIPLGPFSRREALNYLVGRLTMDLDQRQGAIDLISDLRCEPLALAQASAVIADSELTCHSYREHFAARRERAMSAAGGRELAAAAIAWELSIEHADLMAPGPAQPLLAIAALLDGNGIPDAVFVTRAAREYCIGHHTGAAADGGGQAIRDGLALLESAGLLMVGQAPGAPMIKMRPMIRMSWPVQAAVLAAMPDAMLQAAAVAAADAVLEAWPTEDAESAAEEVARRLRSCADSLQRAAGPALWQGGCHRMLLRAGRSLDAARLTGPALVYWEELAATSARLLGGDHPATSGINERLARAYLAGGQAAKAVPLLQAIRGRRAERFGPGHPGTLDVTRALGQALASAGRFGEAVDVLTQAADSWDWSREPDGIGWLDVREDLAATHRAAGELAPAIELYRAAADKRERLQGPRHAATLATREKLAEVYLADGQAKASVAQYERVVSGRERVLGADHLLTIAARGALAIAYHTAGKMAAAVRLGERTRTDYASALGPDHPQTLAACVNLANAYYGVGRITDAARLLQETVERCEKSLPAFDPLTVAARESLININGPRG